MITHDMMTRGTGSIPIALDPLITVGLDQAAITERIRRVVRSVCFRTAEDHASFAILGPDMRYHDADPLLSQGLEFIRPGMSANEIAHFRETRDALDLCLEDCWSGYFIAPVIAKMRPNEDLILIHLDDHTDMMPTLLEHIDGVLIDPTSGRVFDPACAESWVGSISSGCVSIGNFITPLFYAVPRVHVRHLNNADAETSGVMSVGRAPASYDIIPDKTFAAIDWTDLGVLQGVGSYQVGSKASALLAELPSGRVLVHIDFDYFINDFNGNIGVSQPCDSDDARTSATPKLDTFFAALHNSGLMVDRWILATSPGFCSGRHWRWLFEEIVERVSCFSSNEADGIDTIFAVRNGDRSIGADE